MKKVDVLDLMIVENLIKDNCSRRDVAERVGVSKDRARTRLEGLWERNLIGKTEKCSSCHNVLSECICGNYSKKIIYFRDGDEEDAELLNNVWTFLKKMNSEGDEGGLEQLKDSVGTS